MSPTNAYTICLICKYANEFKGEPLYVYIAVDDYGVATVSRID